MASLKSLPHGRFGMELAASVVSVNDKKLANKTKPLFIWINACCNLKAKAGLTNI